MVIAIPFSRYVCKGVARTTATADVDAVKLLLQLDRRHTARAVSAKPRPPGTDRRVILKTTNPVSAGS
jgi:hypothetical protein